MNQYQCKNKSEVGGNYFVVTIPYKLEKYQVNMLINNAIPNMLNITTKQESAGSKISYLVNGMVSMEEYTRSGPLDCIQLEKLVEGIRKIVESCKDYFLHEDRFVLSPKMIYMDVNTYQCYFTYIPSSGICISLMEQIKSMIEFVILHINKQDENAIGLVHQLAILVDENNFSASAFKKIEEVEEEAVEVQGDLESIPQIMLGRKFKGDKKVKERKKEKVKSEITKEGKMTFIILEGISLLILLLVISKVLFSSKNEIVIVLKGVFFFGLFAGAQLMLVSKFLLGEKLEKVERVERVERVEKAEKVERVRRLDYRKIGDIVDVEKEGNVKMERAVGKREAIKSQDKREKDKNWIRNSNHKDVDDSKLGYRNLLHKKLEKKREEGKVVDKDLVDKIKKPSQESNPYLINTHNEKVEIKQTPFTIGSKKGEVDLVINNRTVSKIHSRVFKTNDTYFIEDIASKNGTYINGEKVDGQRALYNNSRITFSNENYVFRWL